MPYCLDSSSLIHAWTRVYPIDVFPSFWENIKANIESGSIFICRDVLEELERKEDGLVKWLKGNLADSHIVDLDNEVQKNLRCILKEYPKFVESRSVRNGADPIVIATSKAYGYTVVSEEDFSVNAKKVKIPNVCAEKNIKCIKLMEFIRESSFKI